MKTETKYKLSVLASFITVAILCGSMMYHIEKLENNLDRIRRRDIGQNNDIVMLESQFREIKDVQAYYEMLSRMSHIETKDVLLTSGLNRVVARVDHLERK